MHWAFRLIVLCTTALIASSAPAMAQAVTAASASIAGRIVTDEKEPRPIRRAVVTIKGTLVRERIIITDDEGRFTFAGLPAGQFTLTAAKAAYVETTYGATKPGGAGVPLALAVDTHIEVTIQMPYGAVLEGTVTSLANETLSGVQVSAQRIRSGADPQTVGQGAVTDDRGIYRIFGLPAGNYVVTATLPLLSSIRDREIDHPSTQQIDTTLNALGRRESTPSSPPPGDPRRSRTAVSFAAVFYPGVPSADEATALALGPGEERAGLDFVFEPWTTAAVAGVVSGPVRDPTTVQVMFQSADRGFGPFGSRRSIQPTADGTFQISGVAPGRYRLSARAQALPSKAQATDKRAVSSAAADAAQTVDIDFLYAVADVEVRGVDVGGVALVLQPGGAVNGRIAFDGPPPTNQLGDIRVTLTPAGGTAPVVGGNSFTMLREARVRADGTFTVTGIGPGTYSLRAALPSAASGNGWRARSAMFENRDLLDVDPQFTPGAIMNGVVLTFSRRETLVSGVLRGLTGEPVGEYFIIVFSTDPQTWSALARRTQVVRPASDGRFEVRNLPTGDYLMAVVRSIDPNEVQTSGFFERLVPLATRITLGEGEQRVQDLQIRR